MIRSYVEGDSLEGLAEELYQELEPRMMKAVEAGGDVLLGKVQDLLSRSGESIPGAPPAERTGELRNAFRRLPAKKRGRTVRSSVAVWDDDPKERSRIARKAAALEHGGTDRKGRVHPAYPYMRPAEQIVEEKVRETIDRVLSEGN